MPDARTALRPWRRGLLRHRRLLVALLGAAAVVAFAEQVSPPAPPHTPVVVAARDLQAGVTIGADDIRVVAMPAELVPRGIASTRAGLLGETLAGPVRAGEPLTDRRVLAASLVRGYPAGTVAAPVRVHDADVVTLLEVGDRIDVYAAGAQATAAETPVVSAAPVVALPAVDDSRTGGGLVVLAVDRAGAARLAGLSDIVPLSVVLRG